MIQIPQHGQINNTMKKTIILLAFLSLGIITKAQTIFYDTNNVNVQNVNIIGTNFVCNVSWNRVDSNTYYLKRQNPNYNLGGQYESHTFSVPFYNVYGQNILTNLMDSVYVYTRKQ